MSLESKVFFPLARIVFLILGVLFLVATIGSGGWRPIMDTGSFCRAERMWRKIYRRAPYAVRTGRKAGRPSLHRSVRTGHGALDTLEMKFRGAANSSSV
jgi:hypothetical protein